MEECMSELRIKNMIILNKLQKLQGKEFLDKLIHGLVADVPSLEEASSQKGSGGLAGLMGKLNFSFKSFIGEFFRQGYLIFTKKNL